MKHFVIVLLSLLFSSVHAQLVDDNVSTEKFYTTETEHFKIVFPISMKRIVAGQLQMLENSYDTITKMYDYEPISKTTLIVRDEDISNGWAAASINNFSIWPTASEYLLRGTHDWEKDVIAHEFSHIITIAPSYRLKPFIPDLRMGYISSLEDQKLFSVVSTIIPFSSNPMWFLEGIAQYSSFMLNADQLDTHRKMILRSDALHGNILTLDEMRVFSKDALGSERVYNHGFSLTKYIADKYSIKVIGNIIKQSGSIFNSGFYSSFKKVTGDNLEDVYEQWKASLIKEATQVKDSLNIEDGELLFSRGFYSVFPEIINGRVKIKSTLGTDFGPISSITVPIEYRSDTLVAQNDSLKMEKVGINFSYNLSKDSSYYLFSKTKTDGSNQKQLRIAFRDSSSKELKYKDEIDLEKLKRVGYTAINPKNDSLFAFIMAKPGYNIIGVATIKGDIISQTDTVTSYTKSPSVDSLGSVVVDNSSIVKDRASMFGVSWIDSTKAVFSYYQTGSRDIGVFDFIKKEAYSLPLNTKNDERDPFCLNQDILYSSDMSGIFNIYSYNLITAKITKITEVVTGAFMPNANDSLLAFSMYGKTGYEVRVLKNWKKDSIELKKNEINIDSETFSNMFTINSTLKLGKINDYKITPNNYLLSPMIFSDQYGFQRTLKLGLSGYFFDPLMRFNLGIYGAYNVLNLGSNSKDFDVGAISEIKTLPWTVSGEVYYSAIDSRVNYRSDFNGNIEQDSIMYTSLSIGINNRYQFKESWSAYKAHLFLNYSTSGATVYDNPYLQLNYNYYTGFYAGIMFSKYSYIPSKEFNVNPIGTFAKIRFAVHVDSLIYKSSKAYEVFYVTPNGVLKTKNSGFIYPSFQADFKKFMPMPKIPSLTLGLIANTKLAFMNNADSIFHNPNSGFLGISAYPLKKDSANWGYSGLYNVYLKGDVRFPIIHHIDQSLGFIYFDRLYGSVFGEYAFSEVDTKKINLENILHNSLKGIGTTVRLETTFGSSYPWLIQIGTSIPIESTPKFNKYVMNINASMGIDRLETIESPFY